MTPNDPYAFYVNHYPTNSTPVTISLNNNVGWDFEFLCDYTYSDLDNDTEQGTIIKWFIDSGTGFTEASSGSSDTFATNVNVGDLVKCTVKAGDEHGLSDIKARHSNEYLVVGMPPPKPEVWALPAVIGANKTNITGYINMTGINVTAFARQGYEIPYNNTAVSGGSSPYYGKATTIDDFSKGSTYFVIKGVGALDFLKNRWVEFANHKLQYYERYNITKNAT